MGNLTQKLFRCVCQRDHHLPENYDEDYFQRGLDDTLRFLGCFGERLEFKHKTVLDFGCGYGSTCIYMALHGASRVVGIDIDKHRIAFARDKLANQYQRLSDSVEFRLASEVGPEKFDLVLSKDSFEHYAHPEASVATMKQHLRPGGALAIGFGPLWKSPYGGHIDFMTRLPWAHLLFPETVIMQERKKYRPDENAESFEQIRGGLNKMTLAKYLSIIRTSDLEFEFFETNVSDKRIMAVASTLAHIPPLKEFLTINLYSIMRPRPTAS